MVVADLEVGVLKSLGRMLPMVLEGVILPLTNELGVRPPADGVILPLECEAEGVRGAEKTEGVILPELAGVARPPREDATEEGRGTAPGRTVGADSFEVATKTPHLSGHEKYCFLREGGSALVIMLRRMVIDDGKTKVQRSKMREIGI